MRKGRKQDITKNKSTEIEDNRIKKIQITKDEVDEAKQNREKIWSIRKAHLNILSKNPKSHVQISDLLKTHATCSKKLCKPQR